MLSLIFQGLFLREDTTISHTYKNLRQHFHILPLKTFAIKGEASLPSHIPVDRMILEIRLIIAFAVWAFMEHLTIPLREMKEARQLYCRLPMYTNNLQKDRKASFSLTALFHTKTAKWPNDSLVLFWQMLSLKVQNQSMTPLVEIYFRVMSPRSDFWGIICSLQLTLSQLDMEWNARLEFKHPEPSARWLIGTSAQQLGPDVHSWSSHWNDSV